MRRNGPILLLALCALVLFFGLARLFQARYESGDVYPPYSSLRADPLGAMAFYESLEKLDGVTVQRDFSDVNRLPEGRQVTYLHLAGEAEQWQWIDNDLAKLIDGFLMRGGRLVIAFEPRYRPVSTWTPPTTTPPAGKKKGGQQKSTPLPRPPGESIRTRWGVDFGYSRLEEDEEGVHQPVLVTSTRDLGLPEELTWHSGLVLTNLDSTWRTLYARGTNAVVAERGIGKGTLVLCTDCYFVSNEALLDDPQPEFLAWLVGAPRQVVFDEAHFGIVETTGVAKLMRKYRLFGVGLAFLVLAALFVWKNSLSLVPPPMDPVAEGYVLGKEAGAGFTNLLRRNIPASDLIRVCFDQWTRSLAHGSPHLINRVDKAQELAEAENALPARARNPVATYREICRVLQKTGKNS
jgi:hypothetical protein